MSVGARSGAGRAPVPWRAWHRALRDAVSTYDRRRCSRRRPAALTASAAVRSFRTLQQGETGGLPHATSRHGPMSKGRHGWARPVPSAWKPYSVVRHRLSTPPTTAASQSPPRSCEPRWRIPWRSRRKRKRRRRRALQPQLAADEIGDARSMFWVVAYMNSAGRAPVADPGGDTRAPRAESPRCWSP